MCDRSKWHISELGVVVRAGNRPSEAPVLCWSTSGPADGDSHSGLSDWLNSQSAALRQGGLVKRFFTCGVAAALKLGDNYPNGFNARQNLNASRCQDQEFFFYCRVFSLVQGIFLGMVVQKVDPQNATNPLYCNYKFEPTLNPVCFFSFDPLLLSFHPPEMFSLICA